MIERYFRAHPRGVGESYLQHLRSASWFAGTMVIAGLACFIHALVPGLFQRTGSAAIERLHDRMVVNRRRGATTAADPRSAAAALADFPIRPTP